MTSATSPIPRPGPAAERTGRPHPDWLLALALYALTTGVYLLMAPRGLLTEHTPYNHFALLAECWLDGRLDLGGPPPAYAHNNDFALFEGRHYVAFPPLPALLILPLVWLAGGAEGVADGQFFIWLAGVAPAATFLALQQLAKTGHCGRSMRDNLLLAALFAFGSVYFFTAVQGTVWFAAHVVGTSLAALFLLFAVDARRPWLAGLMIGGALLTRAPLLYAAPFFMLELARVAQASGKDRVSSAEGGAPWERFGTLARALVQRPIVLKGIAFLIPVLGGLVLTLWLNHARFGDPFESGYQYLTVAWQKRMQKWGLFHYHYLPKNLGVVLTSLPWVGEPKAPFRINAHGLALWFTTPVYLYLLWPKQHGALSRNLWLTVAAVALPTLLYQNTGWAQFGYRFSNDYAVFLFALLALGMRPLGWLFRSAALFAVVVNTFGAASFGRREFRDYYFFQGSQVQLYQKD